MRRWLPAVTILLLMLPVAAQQRPRRPPPRFVSSEATTAEAAIRRAAVALGEEKVALERDLKVLVLLQTADEAMVDPMQPAATIQKALEQVQEAERLNDDFVVKQGLILARQELEAARRSPISADFGRLRAVVRDEALRPAARLAARNALRLEEETLAWIKVQQQIGDHLRMLSEIAGESMRAAQK